MLQPKSARWPVISGATVGGYGRLSLVEAKTAFEKSKFIDALSICVGKHAHDLVIFGVHGREDVDPFAFVVHLGLVDDEVSPPLTHDQGSAHLGPDLLEPVPDRRVCYRLKL